MSLRAWEAALDALEFELDRVESALASGELADVSASPPSGLGTLPVEMRFRATALHARMGRVEEALAGALVRTRQSLALADRRDPLAEMPRFLDARG